MPYIKQSARQFLADGVFPNTTGELNFLVTEEVLAFFEREGESYATYNTIVGIMTRMQFEIHAERMFAPSRKGLGLKLTGILANYTGPGTLGNEKRIPTTLQDEFIGVLECAKLELYRRYVADYEDEKMEQNGDVY